MIEGNRIVVIIPVLNEEAAIGEVLDAIPSWVDRTIVVDNDCTDRTPQIARNHGALVIHEPRRGYGWACQAGLSAVEGFDIVVFLDGDASVVPEEMKDLIAPILRNQADFIVGSRTKGKHEPGSLPLHALWGNLLACRLIRLFWGVQWSDVGPFRAIRIPILKEMGMRDCNFGWTVEMQVRAVKCSCRVGEIPVSYRKRKGKSKITGTLKGSIQAGIKILYVILRERLGLTTLSKQFPNNHLVVFTRYPRPGTTKTRLIPSLGPGRAAWLHRCLTEHTTDCLRDFISHNPAHGFIAFWGASRRKMRKWLGPNFSYRVQSRGDLGHRLQRAIHQAFKNGARKVIAIGSDCPDLSKEILNQAIQALNTHCTVLGPAEDGGYYLIGMRHPNAGLFTGIEWGTDRVFKQTLETLHRRPCTIHLLPKLQDIDRPSDVIRLTEASNLHQRLRRWDRISVIIPVLNELEFLPHAIQSAQTFTHCEIIVVDGGSTDGSVTAAQDLGVKILQSPPGRGAQMNCGAMAATGKILLFLHADTLLPKGFDEIIFEAMADPQNILGAFRFKVNAPDFGFRILETAVDFRSRRLHLPYGDQAFFLRRDDFFRLGMFPEVPILEDYLFVKKAQRHGRIFISSQPALTSSRRWEKTGLLKTTWVNLNILIRYHCGLSLDALAEYHRRAFR